ncbi:MAG: PAS domain-containing protein [Rhodospirillaceae bacterium]|nr:PAS domain-containing protein [Rhodospirillaceae bacterium]
MLQIIHPRCQAFLDHWRALPRRAGAVLPHTNDYLDKAPATFMASVFIHELIDDRLMVRFMGSDLVQRWQRDDTGREFAGSMPLSARQRVAGIAKTLIMHPCGMVQHGVMGTSAGREATFEGVLLPLAVDADAPPRIVVFSAVLDNLARQEHSHTIASAGQRDWIDLGAGVPAEPMPLPL